MALPASTKEAQTPPRGVSRTRLWQRLLLAVMTRLSTWLQSVSRERAMRFGTRFGHFAHFVTRHFAKRSQKYAHRNLRITQFPRPALSFAERDTFIRSVFVSFAKSAVDFLRGPTLTRDALFDLVSVEGLEHVETAYRRGRGVIFASAHLGNWELAARYLVASGFPMTVVAREPEDGGFSEFIRAVREEGGYRVLYRGSSGVREMLSLLRRSETVALLPDQNSGDFFIPFFGVPAGTVAGPATLALHTGATLLVGVCLRQADDTYRLTIHPPIDTTPTSDRQADVVRVMTEVNRQLEALVREYPDQWLWLHNRWKSAFDEGNRDRAFPAGIPADLLERWESGG